MATINIRVDDKLKKESEEVFDELGLNITSALTIFLKAVVRTNSIPFPLEIAKEDVKLEEKDIKKSKKPSTKEL